jgi:hypothetical protein
MSETKGKTAPISLGPDAARESETALLGNQRSADRRRSHGSGGPFPVRQTSRGTRTSDAEKKYARWNQKIATSLLEDDPGNRAVGEVRKR